MDTRANITQWSPELRPLYYERYRMDEALLRQDLASFDDVRDYVLDYAVEHYPCDLSHVDEIAEDLYHEKLVAAADIAQRCGFTVDAVHQWSKRHPEFRALAQQTSAGLIWHWSDAEAWLRETGRL